MSTTLFELCPVCDGTGRNPVMLVTVCQVCNGEKYVETEVTHEQVAEVVDIHIQIGETKHDQD